MYIDLSAEPPVWPPSPRWLADLATTLLMSGKLAPANVAALLEHARITAADLMPWSGQCSNATANAKATRGRAKRPFT